MSLKDEIKELSGNRRRFFLLRVADVDTDLARNLCGVKKGTYNFWLQNSTFVELYRKRDALSAEYKQEAIQLLRRDNQLEAVLLEGKIIQKMKEEIESGEYSILKSHIAREVYSKLISDLDVTPQVQSLTWQQRLTQFITAEPLPQSELEEGIIEGSYEVVNEQPETASQQTS